MNRLAPFLALFASLAARWRPRQDALPVGPPIGAGGIYNPMSGLGWGGVDSGASTIPSPGYRLSVGDQDTLYEDNGYARRIVDEIVDDATRKGWHVLTEGDEDEELRALDETLQVKLKIAEGAKAGRRYGTAFVLLVLDEEPNAVRDGGYGYVDLAQPPRRVRAVRNLVVLDPDECFPMVWDTNPRSPTYRYPLVYQVAPSDTGDRLMGALVHTSRLLIFRGYRLTPRRRRDNQDRDLSVLQPAWPQLSNLTQADSAGVAHMQDASVGVLKIAGKAALDLGDQGELTQLRLREVAMTKSRVGLLILDEHETYDTVAHTVSGLPDLHDRAKESLAAVSAMPMTRLYGQAPGGLNADGDSQASAWREQTSAYQQDDLAPELERYYTYQMQALNRPPGADWKIVFAPLDEPTEQQRAETRKLTADTDAVYFSLGVYTADEIRAQRFGEGGFNTDLVLTPDLAPDPLRIDAEDATAPPQAVRDNAARALKVRASKPPSERGMTSTGLARARDLANGRPVSLDTARRMVAYFERHEVDKQGETWDEQGKGWQAWNGWGGDEGWRWAKRLVAAAERETP